MKFSSKYCFLFFPEPAVFLIHQCFDFGDPMPRFAFLTPLAQVFKNRPALLPLLIILLAGFFLRLSSLTREGLWLDEGITAYLSSLPVSEIIKNRASDVHPPLYFVFLRGWVLLFGSSEAALRFPSLLAGVAAIALLFLLARKLFSPAAGLFASLLLAFSPLHLYFSEEARSYAMALALGLAAFYFALKTLESSKIRHALLYGGFQALALYFHFSGFFFAVSANLYFLFLWRFRFSAPFFKPWLYAQGFSVLLFLPWLSVLLSQVQKVKSGFWIPFPGLQSLIDSAFEFFGSVSLFIWLGVMVLFLFFFRQKSKAPALKNSKIFLWLWILCPWIFSLALSYFLSPVFNTRMVLASSLGLYALLGWVFSRLRFQKTLLALTLLFTLLGVLDFQTRIHKEQWREAALFLKNETRPGDLILTHANYGKIYILDYYFKEKDRESYPFPLLRQEEDYLDRHEEDLKRLTAGKERVWLVYSHDQYHDPERKIYRFLKNSRLEALKNENGFAHIKIYRFDLP